MIKILDIDKEIADKDTQVFKVENLLEKNLVYLHSSSGKVKVCFHSNVSIYMRINIDVNLKLPENLISQDHMLEFETMLYDHL